VPKVGRDLDDIVGRIAEFRVDAIESRLRGLDGIRGDLQVFLVTLLAEDFEHAGVVVEAREGRAQRGHVENGTFASFHDLRDKYRLGQRIRFGGRLGVFEKSFEFDDENVGAPTFCI
jgi:hypothetical protein